MKTSNDTKLIKEHEENKKKTPLKNVLITSPELNHCRAQLVAFFFLVVFALDLFSTSTNGFLFSSSFFSI